MVASTVVSIAATASSSGILPSLELEACCVGKSSDHREKPGDREVAPEDARLLASLDQRREERNDRELAAVQLLWREAARVDR